MHAACHGYSTYILYIKKKNSCYTSQQLCILAGNLPGHIDNQTLTYCQEPTGCSEGRSARMEQCQLGP